MKAIRIHRFGTLDVIVLDEANIPTPGEGEVRVRVHAAGVGPWGVWVRAGKSVLPQSLPPGTWDRALQWGGPDSRAIRSQ